MVRITVNISCRRPTLTSSYSAEDMTVLFYHCMKERGMSFCPISVHNLTFESAHSCRTFGKRNLSLTSDGDRDSRVICSVAQHARTSVSVNVR